MAWSEEAGAPKRRLLYFTKSSGFQHSVITRQGENLSHSEKILTDLATKHNFEITCTKDGTVFNAANIAKYDAFMFYTTGDLTQVGKEDHAPAMTKEGKALLLAAVKSGKGFIGSHSASDTFHSPGGANKDPARFKPDGANIDPYIEMLGGEFITHGEQQKARMTCVDAKFSGCGEWKEGVELVEEWYATKNHAKDLHVILIQETKGMKGGMYNRPPFPSTWAHEYGKGRVFYTSMGHREDIWTNPLFQNLLLGGIAWAFGDVKADLTPNIVQVTPQYETLGK